MYSADRAFLKKLKTLDPNLGVKYEQGHEHFVITYRRAIGEPVPVMLIEDASGGFRHPDDRDIVKLQEGDLHRVPLKDKLKIVARYMEEDRSKVRKTAKDNIRDMTKDNKIQLMRAFANAHGGGGKNNATFDRITPRSRGQVF
jgi:hypothetical protein